MRPRFVVRKDNANVPLRRSALMDALRTNTVVIRATPASVHLHPVKASKKSWIAPTFEPGATMRGTVNPQSCEVEEEVCEWIESLLGLKSIGRYSDLAYEQHEESRGSAVMTKIMEISSLVVWAKMIR